MAFLAVFGTLVEGSLGFLRFLTLYLVAGVAGALLHVAVDPVATIPLVGASGCVFGILAVAGVLRPHLLGFVMAFAGIEIWHAFAGGAENVSFACHLGGLGAGALFAALWREDNNALEIA
jgi:membrane associated rhomboid family serine protease